MEYLHEHVELEGVADGKLSGPHIKSKTAGVKALSKHRLVCSSGDHGALSVWQRDDGQYHCEMFRWQATVAKAVVKTKREVGAWLAEHLPQQHQPQ